MTPHAHYRPPDHSKGDESTIGGYMAVHDRPAAFEGSDGFSYSVEILAEETDNPEGRWQAFFLFVKWSRLGAQSPEGHLESDYLASAPTESLARARLGEYPLADVKALIDQLIAERAGGTRARRWWDAMRDESDAT
ncbi:MAG TPA: hypothetical protein VF785_02480 [Gemmatimonadaceae bacterium]